MNDDRQSIARLILIRSQELELRQLVHPRLRGDRAIENLAEIDRLTTGIAELYRDGLKRLQRWRAAAEHAE